MRFSKCLLATSAILMITGIIEESLHRVWLDDMIGSGLFALWAITVAIQENK